MQTLRPGLFLLLFCLDYLQLVGARENDLGTPAKIGDLAADLDRLALQLLEVTEPICVRAENDRRKRLFRVRLINIEADQLFGFVDLRDLPRDDGLLPNIVLRRLSPDLNGGICLGFIFLREDNIAQQGQSRAQA